MHRGIYEELKRIAKTGNYTTYAEVGELADLHMNNPGDRDEISQILDEISTHEHAQGRPMLSAVVIRRDKNVPGEGFFKLARELGLYAGNDDLKFFLDELKRVHQYWSSAPAK